MMRVRAAAARCALLMLPLLQPTAAETTWQQATSLKSGIEDIVGNQALLLQRKFSELSGYTSVSSLRGVCTGSDGPFCNINEPAFYSSNPLLVKDPQHSNVDGSCAAIDRDKCGYPLAVPITGRTIHEEDLDARKESCRAPAVKKCGGEYEFAAESKVDTLADQGCIDESDGSICKMNVDPGWVGYSFPEISQYSLDDLRVRQEVCTGNYLVDHDDDSDGVRDRYSIAAVKEEYPYVRPPHLTARARPRWQWRCLPDRACACEC